MRSGKTRIGSAYSLRTSITRSALVLLHYFTSAERVMNVGTTSAERVMNVGTTSDERGEHKEKRWCETGRDEELKREGEVYM